MHLLEPQWRDEPRESLTLLSVRLEELTSTDQQAKDLRATGYELFVVHHEYVSLLIWRAFWENLDCDLSTFQRWPIFGRHPQFFDGQRSRLYCYSNEIYARYATHQPLAELLIHLELDNTETPTQEDDNLLWLSRIDEEQAPHIAILVADQLGRCVTLADPVFDNVYVAKYRHLFDALYGRIAGEVGGNVKSALLTQAGVLVYAHARDYIEAGAAVFGEAQRAGIPVAALAWKHGTRAQAARCEHTDHVILVAPVRDDETIVIALAETMEHVSTLPALTVQDIGRTRFDSTRYFRSLATRPC